MEKPTIIRDPNLRRLVYDFDALANELHTLIDRDSLTRPHRESVPDQETEFTTEWQMEPDAEEVHQS
jgi:hypothetical protein